jgi:HD-GYP domain-containing protein (c-di-GMP phosphodiesterase class II)
MFSKKRLYRNISRMVSKKSSSVTTQKTAELTPAPQQNEPLFFSEQELMTMLSHLNFGVLPEGWKQRQQNPVAVPTEAQRIEKIKTQLSELINHYAFEKMLAPLGLPVASSGVQAWLYPLLSYALAQLLQVSQVSIYQQNLSNPQHPRLVLLANNTLPIDTPYGLNEYAIAANEKNSTLSPWANMNSAYPPFVLPQLGGLLGHPSLQPTPVEEHALVVPFETNRQASGMRGLLVLTQPNTLEWSLPLQQTALACGQLLGQALTLNQLAHQTYAQIKASQTEQQPTLNLEAWQAIRNEFSEEVHHLVHGQEHFLANLNNLIDERRGVAIGSSLRVATLVEALSNRLQLNPKTIDTLKRASLFSQVGKAQLPTQLLSKPTKLTPEELESVRQGAFTGLRLLSHLYGLADTLPYLHFQHERWNGSGYPEGLTQWDIPFGSRLLALCQAYQTMREPTAYRAKGMSKRKALLTLSEEAHILWDPLLVEELAKLECPPPKKKNTAKTEQPLA